MGKILCFMQFISVVMFGFSPSPLQGLTNAAYPEIKFTDQLFAYEHKLLFSSNIEKSSFREKFFHISNFHT
jgi:hypothetical protein